MDHGLIATSAGRDDFSPPVRSTAHLVDESDGGRGFFEVVAMDLEDELERCMKMEKDWDSYGADPPNEISAASVRRVVSAIHGYDLPSWKIDVSPDGSIVISFEVGEKYADIECLNNGEVVGITSVRYEMPKTWPAETDDGLTKALAAIQTLFKGEP